MGTGAYRGVFSKLPLDAHREIRSLNSFSPVFGPDSLLIPNAVEPPAWLDFTRLSHHSLEPHCCLPLPTVRRVPKRNGTGRRGKCSMPNAPVTSLAPWVAPTLMALPTSEPSGFCSSGVHYLRGNPT